MRAAAFLSLGVTIVLVAGCSASKHISGTGALPGSLGQNRISPHVKQGGPKPITWVQFTPPAGPNNSGIVVGPDKNMWFRSPGNGGITQMTMTGATTTFPVTCFGPNLTVGADGNFYSPCATQAGQFIAQVSPTGVEQDFPIPSGDQAINSGITAGPDGNVWFVDNRHVGRITPTGQIAQFMFPGGLEGITNSGITSGSDGKVWFSEGGAYIDSVDPGSGTIHQYSPNGCTNPESIVSGADGNLYFDCANNVLGQMAPTNPSNVITIPQPWGYSRTVQDLAIGSDSGIWFVSNTNNIIGEYNYISQTITAYIPPQTYGSALTISAGPDGNLWTTAGSKIDVYVLKVLTVAPKSLKFTNTGQMLSFKVSEVGTTHWTAQSSNAAVATVAQGNISRKFNVTATGSGRCVITVSDSIGNLINVKVTVP